MPRITKQFTLPKLYPIVNFENLADPVKFASSLFCHGLRMIQIRDKNKTNKLLKLTTDIVLQAKKLESMDGLKRIVIVNDYYDICLDSHSDGLHIGQEDIEPKYAREIIGTDKLLGLSTNNIEQVIYASSNLVSCIDYLGFGPVFQSSSKISSTPNTGLENLAEATAVSPLPIVAIGGILPENAQQVYAAGAASICVISALTGAMNLQETIAAFIVPRQ